MIILGIDTGGTFTDFVLLRYSANTNESSAKLRIHKVLSSPEAPECAILQGIADLDLKDQEIEKGFFIVHGSTVATNAVLESKGAATVYITNHGLADVLRIGRQARSELYNLQPELKNTPVNSMPCFEVGGRCAANGDEVEALTQNELDELRGYLEKTKPDSVAINLLFSYLNDKYEKQIEEAIPDGVYCSRSSSVLSEYREYERGMTTWLNAYVGPLVNCYLKNLCASLNQAQISVMQSSGGTISATSMTSSTHHAVHMLLSGPAGGLAAAKYVGEHAGQSRLLTFDMGGTSTDVALVDGDIQLTNEGKIGSYPVAIPMIDMHTIGAGGGSIASIDAGGLLQVGPASAGAMPGPACYGKGGEQATVTDANLILGRLRASAFLGGSMQLDFQSAYAAVNKLAQRSNLSCEEMALGIIQLANEHMVQALRVMSIQRGIDPRGLTLMSFGGAGGLHVCALAEALDIQQAIVPIHAGVLSALGMLVAPKTRQLSKTLSMQFTQATAMTLSSLYQVLIVQAEQELLEEGVEQTSIEYKCSVDLRYRGQSYTLNVPWTDFEQTTQAFHQRHKLRFGHDFELDVELVNIRVGLFSATNLPTLQSGQASNFDKQDTSISIEEIELYGIPEVVKLIPRSILCNSEKIVGPALITEMVSTTFVAPGWILSVDKMGNLHLKR